MHRNTLLFTLLLAVLAALLVGFNFGRRFQPPQPQVQPTGTPTPAPQARETFTSTCGITFEYPSALARLDGASGSAVFTDAANPRNSIAVTCQADIPRPPLAADKIEAVTVQNRQGTASVSALLYHDSNDQLIFTHPQTGLDVFVAGFGDVFNQILVTLRLI